MPWAFPFGIGSVRIRLEVGSGSQEKGAIPARCNQAELQDAARGAVCARVRLAVDRHQMFPQLLSRQLVWLRMAWAAGAHVRVVHVEAPRVLAQHRQACLTKALDFQSGVPFWRRALALDAATLHCKMAFATGSIAIEMRYSRKEMCSEPKLLRYPLTSIEMLKNLYKLYKPYTNRSTNRCKNCTNHTNR